MQLRLRPSVGRSPLPWSSAQRTLRLPPLSALRQTYRLAKTPIQKPVAETSLRVFPFDQAWGPSVDQASLAPQIFALSLFPYLGFLYFLTQSKKAPPLMLFGFYFLLVFVAVSIPAGIYAKTHYGTSLSNVDWLHGGAEIFLTITNLLIVLGVRQGIREASKNRQD